jgi:hypothetical protein
VEIEITGNAEKIELGGTISKKISLDKILKVLEKNGVNHKWSNEKLILYAL